MFYNTDDFEPEDELPGTTHDDLMARMRTRPALSVCDSGCTSEAEHAQLLRIFGEEH